MKRRPHSHQHAEPVSDQAPEVDHMMTTTDAWIRKMQREREQHRRLQHGAQQKEP